MKLFKGKQRKKKQESLCDLWTTIKSNNLQTTDFQKREKEADSLFKDTMPEENFPNLVRYLDIQVHETHGSLHKLILSISYPKLS